MHFVNRLKDSRKEVLTSKSGTLSKAFVTSDISISKEKSEGHKKISAFVAGSRFLLGSVFLSEKYKQTRQCHTEDVNVSLCLLIDS